MKFSTFLPLTLFTSLTLAQLHTPLDNRQIRQIMHDGLTQRDVEGLIQALNYYKRAATDNPSSGLLGGILGGGDTSTAASTSDSSTTDKTPPVQGKPTSTPSSSDSATSTSSSTISKSVISGSVSSTISGSINATSSAMNSTSSAPSSTSSSSSSSSSSAETTVSTDAQGKTVVMTVTATPSHSATPSSSAAKANSDDSNSGSSLSLGAIIGISVAAGVVVLTLVGCAVWRMKRRGHDEDEAIRWPELNRHGDADTHHALPARVTGQHGIETNPLERSLSNSSSVFSPSSGAPTHSAPPMTLNGSGFGAASSLEDYDYNEKSVPPLPSATGTGPVYGEYNDYDAYGDAHTSPTATYYPTSPTYADQEEDYTNMPPAVQMQHQHSGGGPGLAYDSEDEGGRGAGMSMVQGSGPVTDPSRRL